MEISRTHAHALEKQEVRRRIEALADRVASRLGTSWSWQGEEIVSEIRGAKARVGYDERSVSVVVSVPLAMRPLRRKLESKLDEYLVRFIDMD